ncbi:MAG: hypothetical protein MUO33_02930, partial [Sedimentisphaerales bacterium]|nr:hypothetical protein [Sedimentisphaerales bacterium]
KRFLKTANKEHIDNKLKLSAFKEAANILVLTYINGIANALKVKIEMGMPKFACFHNSVEFMKRASLRGNHKPEGSVSVGQFKINSEIKDQSPIKGRFIIVF